MSFDKPRAFRAAQLSYRLVTQHGLSPTTQSKRWFFELPTERDNDRGWAELLHRIFYDANALMRSREPDDLGWLKLDDFSVEAVDTDKMLTWSGDPGHDSLRAHLPWFLSERAVIWELAACYIVDDAGRYDGISAMDYAELQLYRRDAAAALDEAAAVAFLSRLFPKTPTRGQEVWDDRRRRLANIDLIRPTRHPRRQPDATPSVSGPPAP